ncbi:MAG: hypothetical protein Q8Q09_01305 [Deltaproteobacteria bacterium]|nr:hypothetical protein [Deltaproteobacteria bacterium]
MQAPISLHATSPSLPLTEYTRVSDDAAILVKRQDYPRALNVLQRRSPDERRWRWAFRRVSHSTKALAGQRQDWMSAGLSELVSGMNDRGLKQELALDFRSLTDRSLSGVALPDFTARELWRIADHFGLPMEYLTHITALPSTIDAPIDTARVVIDCRSTAEAHREEARRLVAELPPTEALPMLGQLARVAADAQRDAAARWRALAQRLLLGRG